MYDHTQLSWPHSVRQTVPFNRVDIGLSTCLCDCVTQHILSKYILAFCAGQTYLPISILRFFYIITLIDIDLFAQTCFAFLNLPRHIRWSKIYMINYNTAFGYTSCAKKIELTSKLLYISIFIILLLETVIFRWFLCNEKVILQEDILFVPLQSLIQ